MAQKGARIWGTATHMHSGTTLPVGQRLQQGGTRGSRRLYSRQDETFLAECRKKKIHLQWFSPAHCLVILLSGLSHIGQASELQLATWAKVMCLWAAGGWISNCQVSFWTDCGIISKLTSASSCFLVPWRASLHSALGATAQEYFINRPEGLSATCPTSFRSPEISWVGMSAHIILLCCLDVRWKLTYWGRRCLLTHGLGLPAYSWQTGLPNHDIDSKNQERK